MAAVAEGYKMKQNIFPSPNDISKDLEPTTSAPPSEAKPNLKRSRSERDEQEEELEYSAVPRTLTVTSSFASTTSASTEDDFEEPEWLLPKEVVCADVEMKESHE
jgi:hypothetical protein